MTIEVTTGGPIASASSANEKDFDWLQSAVGNWMARSDMSGEAADFILLAEAGLNRELGPVEIDTALACTADDSQVDISSLNMVRPVALFLTDASTGDEIELVQKSDGTFPYRSTSGRPSFWTIDNVSGGDTIEFDCPADQAYTLRFRYWERFALSDDTPTNWLLSYHPDLYLAATLIWGGMFTRDSDIGRQFAAVLDSALPSVKHNIAQRKRAVATVDSALGLSGPLSMSSWQSC